MAADDWITDTLAEVRRGGLWRELRQVRSAPGPLVEMAEPSGEDDGRAAGQWRKVLQFGSNDYLGLAHDGRLAEAAARAGRQFGTGSTASRLLLGHNQVTAELERTLAAFKATEACLVLPAGYMANLALIGSLVGPHDLVLADRLCHASMLDGARLSGARLVTWRHNDPKALARQLADKTGFRRRLVITESVFSMDGDIAPLGELADVCRRHEAMLVVDEAHATGLFGPSGAGIVELLGLPEGAVTATVSTLSKALGGLGGFICGSRNLIDLVINKGRALAYSTGISPMQAAAGLAAVELVRTEPQRRKRVLEAAEMLRRRLHGMGLETGDSASPIIPIIIGDSDKTVEASRQLWAEGLYVPAIRPPTVPRGSARLRISLTAAHTDEQIEQLVGALRRVMG